MNSYIAKYYSFLLFFGSIGWCTISAQDSIPTQNIPEFQISDKREVMFSEINTQQLDSILLDNYNTSSISNLLNMNSAITIKAYGVTGIGSVSMRGGNANHTAVIWNGFNIQDPLNGGFNFAQSTVNFIDEINIQYGGSSTAFGSGAVGGVIHLDNKPKFNNSFFGSALAKTGSFGLNAYHIELGHGSKKVSTKVRLFKSQINNNFKFENLGKTGFPIETYSNAKNNQHAVLGEVYYQIKRDQLISSQLWYQYNYREIPANMTVATSEEIEEYQTDDWLRWALNWRKTGSIISYEARTGIFYNRSEYVNSILDINSKNNSLKNSSEFLASIKVLRYHKIIVGVINNYTIGLSDNFSSTPSLNTTSLYFAPSFRINKRITLNTSVRQERFNAEFTPITYALNSKFLFYKDWYLTSSFSKNYRTPNFNDLYWNGGFASGNKDLKNESGYSKDIGLGIKKQNSKTQLHSEVTFYHNMINNQIQWVAEGQNWIPRNVKQVNTKGVELKWGSTFNFSKKTRLFFNLNYAYTDAQIIEKSPTESDEVLNKQLIYIPYYQANNYIGFNFKNILFDVSLQYVGYQFTRSDNLTWLEPYLLTDLGLRYTIMKSKYNVTLFGKTNNVFNTVYQVRQWYPMPKMNYEVGINLTIK